MSTLPRPTYQGCDGRKGDTPAASRARNADNDEVETGLSLFVKTVIDVSEQEEESTDSHVGLDVDRGMGGTGAESKVDGVKASEDYDNNETVDASTTAGSGRRVASENTARQPPLYTPQGILRFRSPRALAESAERWRGTAQGRSTSVSEAVCKYGEFTVEQELRKGTPGWASASVGKMPNMYDHTALLGLHQYSPFVSERQERHTKRSERQEARPTARITETTARWTELSIQSNETLPLGSDVTDRSSPTSSDFGFASALNHLSTRRQALEFLMARLSNGNAQNLPSQTALLKSLATSRDLVDRIDDLLARLAPDLLLNEEMKAINLTAAQDSSISDQSYCEVVCELIGTLGWELKREAEQPMQMGVALALWTRSIQAQAVHALVIRSEASLGGERAAADVDSGCQATTGTPRIDRDRSNSKPSMSLKSLADLSEFLLASKAYASFKRDLREFTHRGYRSRIRMAIGDEVVGEDGSALSQEALENRIFEISWLPVHLFELQDSKIVNPPLLSRLSGFVEQRMHRAFHRQSFGQEYCPLQEGFVRLRWMSAHGTARHVDMPRAAGEALRSAFASTPAFLNPAAVAPGPGRPEISTEGKRVKKSDRSAVWGAIIKTFRLGQSSSTENIPLLAEPNTGEKLSSPTQAPSTKTRYLYLCVGHSPPCFVAIDCTNLKDNHDFFDRLKSSYDSTRGYLRRIFSFRQYHHCEFYLFGKWGKELGGPLKKDSFPSPPAAAADASSLCAPRLPFVNLPCGPIPPQEFYDRYYRSDNKYWTSPSAGLPIDRAATSLPLRTEKLDWTNGQHETFHGLLAVEHLCYRRVRLYLVLLVFLGAVLGSLWAFKWEGGGLGSFQNALTPLQLALTVWQITVVL